MNGSITATGLDRATLPAALLPLAKSHLRIDGTYDDTYITDAIARAISWFERVTQISVNKVTWKWSPSAAAFCNGAAPVPVSPVNSFTVADGAVPPADLSASYKIATMSTNGIGLYSLVGAFADGMVVSIPSGYAALTDLDPGITDALLRYTAHLYENREILVPGADVQTPGWMSDVVSTYWMPRA
jgi:uncharacterized phiE125 gp8 family phage protein